LEGEAYAPLPVDLRLATRMALDADPALQAAEADLQGAIGGLKAARMATPYNPELSGSVGRRSSPLENSSDYSISISQRLEIAGQRSRRIAVAESELAAARATVERLRLSTRLEVISSFAAALVEQRKVGFAREAWELTRDIHEAVVERRAAGAVTDLEVNLAVIEQARARRDLLLATRRENESLAKLGQLMGRPPSERPEITGDLAPPHRPSLVLDDLHQRALSERRDLEALIARGQARHDEVALARAEAKPDLTVSASFEREEGTDDIKGFGVSIPLPIFNRNRARIATAMAASERARIEIERGRLDIEHDVALAWRRYQAAAELVDLYEEDMLEQVQDNLQLLRLSFEAGKIGLVQLLQVQHEMLEVRREYVESLAELHQAHAALKLAVGGEIQ
jgi:cobalt-zinc-cadmium efflux system outer membrane protein